MNCPICKKTKLAKALFHNVEIDYCPRCLGLWFEQNELTLAKDEKDKDLKWLDIDLWKEERKFNLCYGIRVCPSCRVPLYEVYYGDSGVIVDVCRLCQGIWLDRAEFKKIINWLKDKSDQEVLNNYTKNLFKEFAEIFLGPETFRDEILDFITILKLLNYKFLVQYPLISRLMIHMYK